MAYQPKSYKKFVATAATATLVATAIVPTALAADASKFTDVSKDYKVAVDYLLTKGIASGTTETTFGTSQNISRGDAAVMIANALKLDTTSAKDAGFQDVNARVAGAVNAIVEAGIASGKTSSTFDPGAYITRQEMAKMLANAYKLTAKENAKFSDVNSNWISYVSALKEAGITLGKTETTFAPTQTLTRGEFALFVHRAEVPATTPVGAINLTAAGSKTLKVQFDKAVDPTVVKFDVKKAGISVNVSKVVFSDDKKSATLELSAKLTEGEYVVNATGATDKTLTASYKAENEKVDSIQILSKVAVVNDSTNPTSATVAYKVSNQYGEDISKTTGLQTNSNNISAVNGVVTISNLEANGQKVGAKIAVTLIDVNSAKTATEVVELSSAATVADVAVTGVYNKDKKSLTEDTNLTTDEFYLLVDAKDQYGNVITDAAKLRDGLILSETNPTIVGTGTTSNKTTFTKVTVDGVSKTAIKLVKPTDGVRAGESTITLISTTTGKNQSYTVKVAEATRADAITLGQPNLVVAGEDALLPVSVLDKSGVAITDVKLLNNAGRGVDVKVGDQKGTFVTQDGSLFVKAPAAAFTKEGIVSVVAQTSTYKVATLTLNVKKAAAPTVVRGLDTDVSTTIRGGSSFNFAAKNLVVEDQYGRVMTDAKLASLLTGNVKVVVKKADSSNDVVNVTSTDITDSKSAKVEPILTNGVAKKGTAKLQFILTDAAGKELSGSTAEVDVRVTDGNEYASYTTSEIGTVYDITAAKTTKNEDYDKEIVVYGVLADGSKVKLSAGTDFTVTSTTPSVNTAVANGVIEAGEATVAYATNATEATATVNVTINATGAQFNQTVTFSKATPVVKAVTVLKGTSAVTTISAAADENFSLNTLTDVDGDYSVEVEDQYGVTSEDGTFSDGTAYAAPRVTIVPVTGTVTITGNGTENATVVAPKEGTAFDVTLTYSGGTTKTVRVNVQ